MVALLGIYVLVVAQFLLYVPLVILTPVPFDSDQDFIRALDFQCSPVTATSMISFIALAGIIVRNSILLVDFIRERRTHSQNLRDVLIEAGSIRAVRSC